jgi:hypothetical protein
MEPTETAGVVPKANWNNAIGPQASLHPLPLNDETGAATGALATWFADVIVASNIPDTPGNSRMMNGSLSRDDNPLHNAAVLIPKWQRSTEMPAKALCEPVPQTVFSRALRASVVFAGLASPVACPSGRIEPGAAVGATSSKRTMK